MIQQKEQKARCDPAPPSFYHTGFINCLIHQLKTDQVPMCMGSWTTNKKSRLELSLSHLPVLCTGLLSELQIFSSGTRKENAHLEL